MGKVEQSKDGKLRLDDKRNLMLTEWSQFVTTQVSKWIDMASNWTIHSTPEKVSGFARTSMALYLVATMNVKF